jgi:hypothetical protein
MHTFVLRVKLQVSEARGMVRPTSQDTQNCILILHTTPIKNWDTTSATIQKGCSDKYHEYET